MSVAEINYNATIQTEATQTKNETKISQSQFVILTMKLHIILYDVTSGKKGHGSARAVMGGSGAMSKLENVA